MVDFSPDYRARGFHKPEELVRQADGAPSQSQKAELKSGVAIPNKSEPAEYSKRMLAESWRLLRERGWERLDE
jgi:hypothetical protein